jgi:hypothetical protein
MDTLVTIIKWGKPATKPQCQKEYIYTKKVIKDLRSQKNGSKGLLKEVWATKLDTKVKMSDTGDFTDG